MAEKSVAAVATPAATGSSATDAEEPVRRPWYGSIQVVLHSHPWLGPFFVLVISAIVFETINPRFLDLFNISIMLQQVVVIGLLALGQTLIMLTAGIDLSCGVLMILAQMIIGGLAISAGVPTVLALLLGGGVGALAGLVNGMLVSRLHLPPFIVTLGTLGAFGSIGLIYAKGQSFIPPPTAAPSNSLLLWTALPIKLGQFQITVGVVIMLVLYLIVGYILSRTAWGRHVYSVGDDPEASRLVGVRTTQLLLSVYVAAGVIYALAGWLQIGRTGQATTNVSSSLNLDSITAVVIGGVSLFGGRGLVSGTLIGVLIVEVFQDGLNLAGVHLYYQGLAEGLLIVAAVALDQWIRRVRA